MTVIDKLASSLNRRDELPNKELAVEIVAKNDQLAIKELLHNLHSESKHIQNDCIKVLYEIGERKPAMLAHYVKEFVALLDNPRNRLRWGGMSALARITNENPKAIYAALSKIIAAADEGSVITKDNAVAILIKLSSMKQYAENAISLLNEQLLGSPPNQLPMYAENALPVIDEKNREVFIRTLSSRLDDLEQETKRKRVEKVLQKLKEK
jgi:hypothetical protein